MGKKILIFTILFTTVLLIFVSCSSNIVYSSEVEIPDGNWKSDEASVFSPDFKDTIQNYNLLISITNSEQYRYSNIWLFINSHSPDGFHQKDTIEVFLSEENGKWLGKKNNEKWTYQFYYKKKIRFPRLGRYTFEIQQGMRDPLLKGIDKISLELEKNND